MKIRRDRRGFTLMEILVAMSLLAVVGVSVLSSFTSASKVVQSKQNIATNVARGHLEQLYEYVRQDWSGNSDIPLALSGATLPGANSQTMDGVTYTTSYTVNDGAGTIVDINNDGIEDYRKVKMTVAWAE